MSSMPYSLGLPVYDNAEFAKGLDAFVIKAKTEKQLHDLFSEIVNNTPDDQVVFGYPLGMRPDHPVPRPMWFIEIGIREKENVNSGIVFGLRYVGAGKLSRLKQ